MTPAEMTKLNEAVNTLIDHLREDEHYAYGWQANIAMAFKDEYDRCKKKYKNRGDIHAIANEAACNFLKLLTRHKEIDDEHRY